MATHEPTMGCRIYFRHPDRDRIIFPGRFVLATLTGTAPRLPRAPGARYVMPMDTKSRRDRAYSPPPLTSEIAYAVQALFAGKADGRQQEIFSRWLLIDVCRKDDIPWFPGGLAAERDSSFANGRRFVALQVLKAFNQTPEMLAMMRAEEAAARGEPITEGDEIGRE